MDQDKVKRISENLKEIKQELDELFNESQMNGEVGQQKRRFWLAGDYCFRASDHLDLYIQQHDYYSDTHKQIESEIKELEKAFKEGP